MRPQAATSVATLYAGLWRDARGSRAKLLLGFALLVVAEMVRLAPPFLAGDALNALQRSGAAGLRHAGRDLLLLFASLLCGWALHAPGRILERNIALRVRATYANRLLDRLLRAPLHWHRTQHSAEIAHRVIQSTEALHQFAETQYVYLQNAVLLIGPVCALWLLSPWVGLAAMAGYGAVAAISLRFDHALTVLSEQTNEAQRQHNAAWTDTLANIFTIHALRRFAGVEQLLTRRLTQLYRPLRRIVWLNEAKWASVDLLGAALWCVLIALYVALQLGRRGTPGTAPGLIALGSIYMVYEYARRAEAVMGVIAADFSTLAQQRANYASGQAILDAPQGPHVPLLAATDWQELQLDRLCYRHPDSPGSADALTNLNLTLRRGQLYALIGPSGAGKSSLLALLAGLDSPSHGAIRLDGRPVGVADLRTEATLVPQQAEMFIGSVAENLTLGASVPKARITQSLHAANATEFVARLAEGLATGVSEGGANWSGGQRQRIALARGVLAARTSSLILFDEPTSNLDADGEQRVLHGLLGAFPGSTIVVALHRMNLLSAFDVIVLMDDGMIQDIGTRAELAARSALFRHLLERSASTRQPACAAP